MIGLLGFIRRTKIRIRSDMNALDSNQLKSATPYNLKQKLSRGMRQAKFRPLLTPWPGATRFCAAERGGPILTPEKE